MRYLSVCSGIEAATVAWRPLEWEAAAFSEIEAFPRAVLQHHYPDTPLHGDFTTIRGDEYGPIDLLVGGTPCQSFSVAGLRGGLADERGNLALEYLRLAHRARPRWLVWENVPGVLSSDGGRDFGSVIGGMVELGYGVAYRVLDAQHFGVPQRRRRVFVVGHLGDWRRAAAVLFERHSLSGDTSPRGEKGQAAPTIPSRSTAGGGLGTDFDCDGGLVVPQGCGGETAPTLNAAFGSKLGLDNQHIDSGAGLFVAHSLRADGFDASEDGTGRGTPLVPVAFNITPSNSNKDYNARQSERAQALTAGGNRPSARGGDLIAFTAKDYATGAYEQNDTADPLTTSADRSRAAPIVANGGVMPAVAFQQTAGTLKSCGGKSGTPNGAEEADRLVGAGSAVRRLTPRECERLQGFPEIHRELKVLVCSSEDEKNGRARSAEQASVAPSLAPNAPVAVNALIDLERGQVQLHSLGRSPWSASIAELASSSRLPISAAAFARLLALMHDAVGRSTLNGRAASPASISGSTHHLNGSASALLCGQEIAALASDAERFTAALTQCLKSTTSEAGPASPPYGSSLQTLACCVSAAISGFIPEAIRDGCSYEIRLTAHQGYTAVPYRGKPAADGPRYKALGNSMAVPVMAWIGRRIAMVEQLSTLQVAA